MLTRPELERVIRDAVVWGYGRGRTDASRCPCPASRRGPGSGPASADAAGTAGHFRIYASDGSTCHMQGTVTATGGGGDLTLDNVSIAAGQSVTITSFTLTEANA